MSILEPGSVRFGIVNNGFIELETFVVVVPLGVRILFFASMTRVPVADPSSWSNSKYKIVPTCRKLGCLEFIRVRALEFLPCSDSNDSFIAFSPPFPPFPFGIVSSIFVLNFVCIGVID